MPIVKDVMYIYVARDFAGHVKVGCSGNPHARLGTLCSPSGHKVKLCGLMEGRIKLENQIHAKLLQWRVTREWYHDTPALRKALSEINPSIEWSRGTPKLRRKVKHGNQGRPQGLTAPCGWGCGFLMTAGTLRKHWKDCPNRPDRKPSAAIEGKQENN